MRSESAQVHKLPRFYNNFDTTQVPAKLEEPWRQFLFMGAGDGRHVVQVQVRTSRNKVRKCYDEDKLLFTLCWSVVTHLTAAKPSAEQGQYVYPLDQCRMRWSGATWQNLEKVSDHITVEVLRVRVSRGLSQ
eukprot:s1389_g20.t1